MYHFINFSIDELVNYSKFNQFDSHLTIVHLSLKFI